MKKIIMYVLLVAILVSCVFVLTGCNDNKETNIVDEQVETDSDLPSTASINSESITLTHNSEANKKEYKIKFDSNTEDNKMYFDTQYPTTAQIRNENSNYVIDIQIDELTQSEYDITIAEEKKHKSFKEEKIGTFDGYSYTDENTETTTAKALIDGNNPEARIYATMIIGLGDESNSNGLTSSELYKSSKVQFIINSITCTVAGEGATTSAMTDKDYYEKAVEFVKNEKIKTEDHINTKEGYHKFAIYEGFGVAEENGTTYAYMHIGDSSYYLENGKIEQGSGSSMAYKVKFVNGEPVSYENPTDGAGQEADYKRLFPTDVFKKIYGYNFDFSKLDDLANEYYK